MVEWKKILMWVSLHGKPNIMLYYIKHYILNNHIKFSKYTVSSINSLCTSQNNVNIPKPNLDINAKSNICMNEIFGISAVLIWINLTSNAIWDPLPPCLNPCQLVNKMPPSPLHLFSFSHYFPTILYMFFYSMAVTCAHCTTWNMILMCYLSKKHNIEVYLSPFAQTPFHPLVKQSWKIYM